MSRKSEIQAIAERTIINEAMIEALLQALGNDFTVTTRQNEKLTLRQFVERAKQQTLDRLKS